MSVCYAVAKIALENNPQLLESLVNLQEISFPKCKHIGKLAQSKLQQKFSKELTTVVQTE